MAEIALAVTAFASAAAPFVATAASVASVASGVMSARETRRQGAEAARTAALNAELASVEADRERLAGQQTEIQLKRDALQRIGQARVAFAGSGLDISSGGALEDSINQNTDFEISIARGNAERAASVQRLRGATFDLQGRSEKQAARVKADSQIASTLISLAKRG